MSHTINKVILSGHLGCDPEIRQTTKGVKVAKLRLATHESAKDANGNNQKETHWHKVVVFGKLADVANDYLKKGSFVLVEGRIKNRSYLDKHERHCLVTEVFAHELSLLEKQVTDVALSDFKDITASDEMSEIDIEEAFA